MTEVLTNYHYFPYRFLMAADFWVFVNMGQAILMSIPILNIYTHGTHVTVAHSMGTTIGINSMIIFAAAFMFLTPEKLRNTKPSSLLDGVFWMTQLALFALFITLDVSGIIKGMWQLDPNHGSFTEMMESLRPMFIALVVAGSILMICFFIFISTLVNYLRTKNTNS